MGNQNNRHPLETGRSLLGTAVNEGALATLDNAAALAEIASGTLSKEIAARYGVTPYAVRKRLAKALPDDYKIAVADQAQSFVEDAMQDVRTCDNDTVAIARARVDAAMKYAQAHNAAYASKGVQINLGVSVVLDQSAVGTIGELLEHVAGQQTGQIAQETGSNDVKP